MTNFSETFVALENSETVENAFSEILESGGRISSKIEEFMTKKQAEIFLEIFKKKYGKLENIKFERNDFKKIETDGAIGSDLNSSNFEDAAIKLINISIVGKKWESCDSDVTDGNRSMVKSGFLKEKNGEFFLTELAIRKIAETGNGEFLNIDGMKKLEKIQFLEKMKNLIWEVQQKILPAFFLNNFCGKFKKIFRDRFLFWPILKFRAFFWKFFSAFYKKF